MATTPLSPAPRKGYAVAADKGVLYVLGGVVQKNKKDLVPGPSALWRYCRGSARWTRLDPPPGDDTPFADAYLTRYGAFLVLPVVTRLRGGTHLGFAAKVFDTRSDAWLPVQANAKMFDTESETWSSPPADTSGVGGGTPSLAFRPYADRMACARDRHRNEIACTLLGDRLFVMTMHGWSRRIFSLRLQGLANCSSTLPDWEHVYHLDHRDPRDQLEHLLYPIVSAYVGRDGNLWFSSHTYELVFAVDDHSDGAKVALRLLSPDFSRLPRDGRNLKDVVPSVHEVVSGSPHFSADRKFCDQYSLEIGGDIVGMSFRRQEQSMRMEYSVWSAVHDAVKWTPLRTPFAISRNALEYQRVRFVHAADTHEIWCVSSGPKGSSMVAFPVLSLAATVATGATTTDRANVCAPATDDPFEACLRALVRPLEDDGAAARPGEVAIAFDDGVRLAACRSLLAAGSEYFRCLFDGPTADARAAELALPAVPSEVGRCALLLLHTGRLLEWPSRPESCACLVQLADYLRLEPHLLGAVHRAVARALTVENVRAVLDIANRIRADALRTACHRYMRSVDSAVLIAMVNAQCGGGEEGEGEEPSAKRARA
jgi:hypothetical protein